MTALACWAFRYETDPRERWEMYRDLGWDETHAMCVLPEGHDGGHEFVPQDRILLAFPGGEA